MRSMRPPGAPAGSSTPARRCSAPRYQPSLEAMSTCCSPPGGRFSPSTRPLGSPRGRCLHAGSRLAGPRVTASASTPRLRTDTRGLTTPARDRSYGRTSWSRVTSTGCGRTADGTTWWPSATAWPSWERSRTRGRSTLPLGHCGGRSPGAPCTGPRLCSAMARRCSPPSGVPWLASNFPAVRPDGRPISGHASSMPASCSRAATRGLSRWTAS